MIEGSVQPKAAENSFNAVRLLAALQVAYIHTIAHLKLSPPWGYEWIAQFPGVPIFFAISGYLVFDSLLRLPTKRDFFRHRVARIYPALFINITILETLLGIGGGLHVDAVGPAKAIFFELVYVVTASDELGFRYAGARMMRSFDGFFTIYPSGVLWTLTVELTFYAVIPLFLFARTQRAAAGALIGSLCIVSIASNDFLERSLLFSLSVIPYFWMFGIGMLFRLWLPSISRWRLAIPSLLIAVLICAYLHGFSQPEWKANPSLVTTIQTICLCCVSILVGLSPIFRSKWLARNDMSYGLYLYHMLLVAALINVPHSDRASWLLIMVLSGSILAGFLSWHLIERPAMAMVRDYRIRKI